MVMKNIKQLNQQEEYINMTKIYGYQRQIYLLLTDRGFGKTYAMKTKFINDFINKGKKFIYLRRYKSEMKQIQTFFDDVAHLYPDHEFMVKGWNFYMDKKIMGMGFVLTRYQDYKGGAYPDYDNLVFDEFLREKVKSVGYLKNDTQAFLSICDSVFRKRDNVTALMLANTISEANPYFLDFKLNRKPNSEYVQSENPKLKNRILAYVREVDEETKSKNISSSPFREILGAIDSYSDSALGNTFSDDSNVFIGKKSKKAKFYFSIRLSESEIYGVWVDLEQVKMYVSKRHEKTTKSVYAFTKEAHNDKTVFVGNWKEHYPLKKLVVAFKGSNLIFEGSDVKMTMYDLFSKMRIF